MSSSIITVGHPAGAAPPWAPGLEHPGIAPGRRCCRMGSALAGVSVTCSIALQGGGSLPDAVDGTPYFATFDVTNIGGLQPYNWSIVDGNLPDGLTIVASGEQGLSGVLSGLPSIALFGNRTFTVRATDSNGAHCDQSFSLFAKPCEALGSPVDLFDVVWVGTPDPDNANGSITNGAGTFDLEGLLGLGATVCSMVPVDFYVEWGYDVTFTITVTEISGTVDLVLTCAPPDPTFPPPGQGVSTSLVAPGVFTHTVSLEQCTAPYIELQAALRGDELGEFARGTFSMSPLHRPAWS